MMENGHEQVNILGHTFMDVLSGHLYQRHIVMNVLFVICLRYLMQCNDLRLTLNVNYNNFDCQYDVSTTYQFYFFQVILHR